ncbi:Histone deacetylase 3 [Rhizophlyctis rosea]|uniref:Histone deacetylase n=1 Tax=Rhizophlyctis rosea TaxID=64517 RepID=A0AAD5X114_9FUNG|nr:Histone deacetylase 3 [Rhizophlyctis rosea]
MKPARLALTHELVVQYGLSNKMKFMSPREAFDSEVKKFHSEDYVDFLRRVTPDNVTNYSKFLSKFNLGVEDCPIFDGLYDFCRMYSGASIEAARQLMTGQADIAINWSGGLHHAKKFEASGFCYVNDIVLAILELLQTNQRVLYVDIDVHHGDGVQEAFYHSDRVMTVSFHRYDGTFFPGTGALDENGGGNGKFYSINVPLHEGIDDSSYQSIFQSVIEKVMDSFQPEAIVLQCGADSLASDRLGSFNLSVKGHGDCVDYMKSFRIPMLVLGGGGYTIRNVARAWTYETSRLLSVDVPNQLPPNVYLNQFLDEPVLHPNIVDANLENRNSPGELRKIEQTVAEYLRYLQGAPSVQMQHVPGDIGGVRGDDDPHADRDEDRNTDKRHSDISIGRKRKDKERNVDADERDYYDGDRDHDRDADQGRRRVNQRIDPVIMLPSTPLATNSVADAVSPGAKGGGVGRDGVFAHNNAPGAASNKDGK